MTTTQVNDSMRNGVDTATLFATLDAVKQAPEAASSSSVPTTSGRAAPITAAPSRTSSAWARSARMNGPSCSTPTTPPCWSAGTTGRRRWSSCCTRWPPASPPAWPTSPPPAACGSPRSAPPSPATSTSTASSASTRCPQRLPGDHRALHHQGDAPADKLRELVEQSRARSAVYDVVTNGVPVTIQVDTPDARSRCHDSPPARIRCSPVPGLRQWQRRPGRRRPLPAVVRQPAWRWSAGVGGRVAALHCNPCQGQWN